MFATAESLTEIDSGDPPTPLPHGLHGTSLESRWALPLSTLVVAAAFLTISFAYTNRHFSKMAFRFSPSFTLSWQRDVYKQPNAIGHTDGSISVSRAKTLTTTTRWQVVGYITRSTVDEEYHFIIKAIFQHQHQNIYQSALWTSSLNHHLTNHYLLCISTRCSQSQCRLSHKPPSPPLPSRATHHHLAQSSKNTSWM